MSKNKKILFSGIFLAAVAAILLFSPTKVAQAGMIGDSLLWALNKIIYAVFLLLANLLKVAGLLFDYVIDPKNFRDILMAEAIYNGWQMMRDFFNIAFILVLLFSAFSTIFQVEKYHIKNILLNLVIIALLVNFSYPIALVVIDASNVVMYYLLNMAFPGDGGSISAGFAKWSGITDAMVPRVGGADSDINMKADNLTMKLIMAIVMLFVLMATMITMAILLVVRVVALAFLVILAPAGFVAGIFPSTKNYHEDWWKNLFKYSFMGPTLAFMILLGLKLMMEMKDSTALVAINMEAANAASSTGDSSFLSNVTFFVLPIVIMWSGMIIAQKLGVAGASLAVKAGQGAAKKFSGFNAGKKRVDAFLAERKKRADEKFKGNIGTKFGKWTNQAQDTAHGNLNLMPGNKDAKKRAEKWNREANKEDIKSEKDKAESLNAQQITDNIGAINKDPNASNADKIKRAGQAQELIARGKEFEDHLSTMQDKDVLKNLGVDAAKIKSEVVAAGGDSNQQRSAVATAVRAKLREQIAESEKNPKSLIRDPLVAATAGLATGAVKVGAGALSAGAVMGTAAIAGPAVGAATAAAIYTAGEIAVNKKRRDSVKNAAKDPGGTATNAVNKSKASVGSFLKDVKKKIKEDLGGN